MCTRRPLIVPTLFACLFITNAFASAAPLTEQQLPDYLRKLGFNPKVVTPGAGPAYCVIEGQNAGATYTVEVSVQRGLWMVIPLRTMPPADQLPGEKLLRLLEANSSMAPCFFCYRAGDNRLCLKLEVIGSPPSENDFRGDLKSILGAAHQSRDLWSSDSWEKAKQPRRP